MTYPDMPSIVALDPLASVQLLEAIGYGPDSEEVVFESLVKLLGVDDHSQVGTPFQRDRSGLEVYSFERWLRLHFTSRGSAISKVRFWIDNLDPGPGWNLFMGVTDTYSKPVQERSVVARQPVPISSPAVPNVYPLPPNLLHPEEQVTTPFIEYSPWLVLQARWWSTDDDPMQMDDLSLSFQWEEALQ